jgi:hypothetical protein
LPHGTELADVVDQRAGVTDGKPTGAVEAGQGVAWAALVGIDPVIDPKDFRQVVLRMLRWAEGVILAGLEDNRIPSVLDPACLTAVAVPLRPIEGLMVVPEAADINVGITETVRGIRKKGDNGKSQH